MRCGESWLSKKLQSTYLREPIVIFCLGDSMLCSPLGDTCVSILVKRAERGDLGWFGHMMGMSQIALRRGLQSEMDRTRRKGGLRTRWKAGVKDDAWSYQVVRCVCDRIFRRAQLLKIFLMLSFHLQFSLPLLFVPSISDSYISSLSTFPHTFSAFIQTISAHSLCFVI